MPSLNDGFRPLSEKETPLDYETYHAKSIEIGDVDPSYEMLRYLCDRFELNVEQRYWLAFLYATCYCGPTVFYIYNEFPDFENVDEGRLERWWAANKKKLYFQTDRRWIRSKDQFCDIFRSYKSKIGRLTQEQHFKTLKMGNPYWSYETAWSAMSDIYQFGRFALFLYLEAVHVVTGFPMRPKSMNLKDAESCRNGLRYALGETPPDEDEKLSPKIQSRLQVVFDSLVWKMEGENPRNSVWNIETTLCAYKKYRRGQRWIGFYLDRQHEEISKMSESVSNGVDWSVLWDYRREIYQHQILKEFRK